MSDARSTRSNLLTRGMRVDDTTVSGGIKFEWDGDWFHVSGTATTNVGWSSYQSSDIPVKAGRTYTLSIDFDGDVPDGYSLSALQLHTDVKKNVYINVAFIYSNPLHATFTVPDGDYERLQIWGPIIKGDATVDMRVRWMLVEGTTPSAWAPAEGEELSGGGALVSANLWDAQTSSYEPDSDGIYTSPKSGNAELGSYPTTSQLAENQTIHMAASLLGDGSGYIRPFVKYEDAAHNANYVGFPNWTPSDTWQRFEDSVVVPSGMTVAKVGFNNVYATGDIKVSNPVFSYGDHGPILASDSHTPYATQDHVAAEYATKAALKVTSDAVTAEVTERGKLAGRVGTLESTSGTHTSRLEQLADAIAELSQLVSDLTSKEA